MNNTQLLASLPGAIDSPWEWQELSRRRTKGQLTSQEVDQAITALISGLKTKRANGMRPTPLSWAGPFVNDAMAAGDVSAKRTAELMEAFYGEEPSYEFRRKVREGEPIRVTVSGLAPWNLGRHRLLFSMGSVRSGETDLKIESPTDGARGATDRSGTHPFHARWVMPQSLPPGRHDLEFVCDMGVVTEDAVLRGVDGRPGPPEKWPDPVARWQMTTRRQVEVVPRDAAVVEVVTDPAQDPFRTGVLSVEQVAVRPASDGVELVIRWNLTGPVNLPMAYQVQLHPAAGGPPIACGTYVIEGWTAGTHTTSRSVRLRGLPEDIRQGDIVMVPDPKLAEHYVRIERIWGQEKVIKSVKIERYDLPNSG